MATRNRYWRTLGIALTALTGATASHAEGQQELLFFLSAGPSYHESEPDDGLQGYELDLNLDAVYTYVNGRFRFLGEYIAATDETELERLQLGWRAAQHSTIWAGRFHSPSRYWNIAYHHGQYLQTSISRPLIEQFEDEGGILPTHVSGVMFETSHTLPGSADFRTSLSLGAAPVIDRNELKPFDLLDPSSNNKASTDIRLAYLPDQLEENQAGVILSWSSLEVDGNPVAERQGLRRVNQYISGAYLDWRWGNLRLVSSLAPTINRMQRRSSNQTDTFVSGYLQPEYTVLHDWTLFGRLEDTTNKASSDYLELFPNSITRRQMLGLRFDFARRQALKLEVAHAETKSDDFDQVLLQWSAVLP